MAETGPAPKEVFTAETRGLRLDQYLARLFPGFRRAYFRGLIERGAVLVDGRVRPADHRLAGGELLRVAWPRGDWPEQPFEQWVLHEDGDILVLNKPAGLLMHPLGESWVERPEAALAEPEPNLAGLLLKHRPAAAASGVERCGLVHRLDRQTSGVLVVAKVPQAQAAWLEGFRGRDVEKTYRAVVLGELARTQVEAPVGRASGRRRIEVTPWGRDAVTEFRALETAGGLCLAEAKPRTGRTHQIRAHLAHLKHPVLGDSEWFGPEHVRALAGLGLPPPPRMLLHAWRLRFAPVGGRDRTFTAPVPKDFRDYWAGVRRSSLHH